MGARAVDGRAFVEERSRDAARLAARARVFAEHPSRVAISGGSSEADEAAGWLGSNGWADAARRTGPDLLLVRRADQRLVGISVAFPSGWSPEDALGREVHEVHAIVPGLNADLGARIRRFLAELPEGRAFARDNWGLARGDALDRHPRHALPRIEGDEPFAELFLRVEEQAFIGLRHAILFAVHPVHHALDHDAELRALLANALATMPADVATYKGLSAHAILAERLARAPDPEIPEPP